MSTLVPALLGAAIAIGVLIVWRPWRNRSAGVLPREAERIEQGLREFAREVEERLDRKLDRLEMLLGKVKQTLGTAAEAGEAGLSRDGGPAAAGEGHAGHAISLTRGEDPLGTVSDDDRGRVLALAARGLEPGDIADEMGLHRGEVDLILRLHRSAERVED